MDDRLLMMDKPLQEAFHNAVQDAFRRGYLAGVGDSSDGWSGEPCADYPPETNESVRQAMELRLLKYEYEMEAAKHARLLEIVEENDALIITIQRLLQGG